MKFKEEDYVIQQNFDISSLDYEKAKLHISGLELFAEATKKCFFIFDYFKHNYLLIKSFNEYFTEIPELVEEPYLFFNNKIHPEDIDFVYQIHHRAFKYISTFDKNEKQNLQLYYNCRFQNKFNEYIMTDICLKLIETDTTGNIWLVLFVLEKSNTDSFIIPYIENKKGNIRQFTLNQNRISLLSKTEKEIIFMLFGNITNIEIAKLMNKSLSTIKTHITKIYNKLNAENRFDFQKKILMQ